jgi:hypothetical protein
MTHCTVRNFTCSQFKRQWFQWFFKRWAASDPSAIHWSIRWWKKEGSLTYKKATPTLFNSHAWECCPRVSNDTTFMHAWQVSTAYFAWWPERLPLQTARSARGQKFRQALGNLPSVSETMASNQDMPDIPMSNKAHFYFQALLLRRTFGIRPQKPHECPLYNTKGTIWCVVLPTVITGPYILGDLGRWRWASHTTIFTWLKYFSCQKYSLPQHKNLWFLQDGATAHHKLFLQQVIYHFSDEPWLPCLPDLITLNIFSEDIQKVK